MNCKFFIKLSESFKPLFKLMTIDGTFSFCKELTVVLLLNAQKYFRGALPLGSIVVINCLKRML